MRSLLCLLVIGASVAAQRLDVLRSGFLPPVDGQFVYQAVSGDFDGDGHLDLAMVDFLSVYLAWNDGTGRFVRRAAPIPMYGAMLLAAADLDGDGHLDLLVGRTGGFGTTATPVMLHGDGTGNFTDVTAQRWPAPSDYTVAFAVFDWDGDGDLDIVTCNGSIFLGCSNPQHFCPAQNRLFLNNGQGFFTDATAQLWPHTPAAHSGIAVGDLDGDGIADLVCSVQNVGDPPVAWGTVRLFLVGTNRVAVEVPGGIPALPADYRCVVLADVDGDGDLDVITASSAGVLVFQNDGHAHFALTATLADPDVYQLQAVDLDGDGRPDLVAARRDHVTGSPLPLRCWRNTANGFVDVTATAVEAAIASPRTVLAFDSDGNGTMDLWGAAIGRQFLWHGDGAGRLLQLSDLEYGVSQPICSVLADIDGDGWPDLATIDYGYSQGTQVAIVRNVGGMLGLQRTVLVPVQPDRQARTLTFVDFDRDGDPDLLVGMRIATPTGYVGQNLMFRNDHGVFTDVTAQSLPVDSGANTVTLAGDLDGDGIPDLLIGQDGGLRLWKGTGAGTFVDMTALLPPVTGGVTCLALIDYDGDGDLDIVWSNAYQPMHLLRNDWPSFTDVAASVLPAVPTAVAIAVCDFDRDGRPDLVVGTPSSLLVWRNAGGTFVDESASRLPATARPASMITVADLDADGWPDLLLFWDQYNWPQQLHNVGGMFVEMPGGALTPGPYPAVGVADIDGDGDDDLVVSLGVLRNLARQLGNSVPPRLGRYGELLLQAYGGNGVDPQTCGLLLAPARAMPPLPIAPLGLLRIDPASAWLHSAHVLPATGGDAIIRYLVPQQPALLGAQLAAQGLFLHTPDPARWRLGNAVQLQIRL